jgi:DNA-binding MarR family transcriptional regulator
VDDSRAVAIDLALAMTRLRARLRRESADADRAWTWSQLSTLRRIIEHGPTTAKALAYAEHVRPQSIAETVAALKNAGLIDTAPDPADRRRTLITASADGRALIDSVLRGRERWLTRALDTVATPEERAIVAGAVGVLNKLAES